MTEFDHHDGQALDLLKCNHWGRRLERFISSLNSTFNSPVIRDDCENWTPMQYLAMLLEAAADRVVERPAEVVQYEGDLEYDRAAIQKFRSLTDDAREIAHLAELIADMLQAPYNGDEGGDPK
jgi:hypothetical protein